LYVMYTNSSNATITIGYRNVRSSRETMHGDRQ
jgi:hypothetical protein